ncbi:MAG: inositol monophosphatase [Dehalococcoidia bacterium]|nr:inositol monophosphatase [Dehalococcoidia bacterium]MDW8119837.1 inositol monophosphatase family protein [Chloroflexota bacterium]
MAPAIPPLPVSASGTSADQVALAVALQAGRTLRQRFGSPLRITPKGPRDLVTEVDSQVEQEVLDALRREFPSFGVMAEETAPTFPSQEWAWILDPLDGTRNFARGIPFFCVSLALAWRGMPVVGVIYDPIREEAFFAVEGRGAWLNGTPMRVSDRRDLASSIVGCDISTHDTLGLRTLALLERTFPQVMGGRTTGSAALGFAYAAAGRLDLYFHLRLRPWDVAAGLVLVQEAGGVALDFHGQLATLTSEGFVVGNTVLVHQFLSLVRGLLDG